MIPSRHFLMRAACQQHRSCSFSRTISSSSSAPSRIATLSVNAAKNQQHHQHQHQQKILTLLLGMGAALTTTKILNDNDNKYNPKNNATVHCAASLLKGRNSTGGDVVMMGTPTKEKSTGILFPQLCNGMTFVGCGVRVKYGFVRVYAVGTYMDPMAMSAVKKQGPKAVEEALLNPMYPRTIRIVMNRGLSIEKYTAAIVEALGPRMNGEDLDKLEEFKKLNPPVDLIEGAEMEMTIMSGGNIMLYKNSLGGVGQIESKVFCKALCDVYYGADPVSPGHKEEVISGVVKNL